MVILKMYSHFLYSAEKERVLKRTDSWNKLYFWEWRLEFMIPIKIQDQ